MRRNLEDSVLKMKQKIGDNKLPSIRFFAEDIEIIKEIAEQHGEWLKFIHFYTPYKKNTTEEINKKLKNILINSKIDIDYFRVFDNCWEGKKYKRTPTFFIVNKQEVFDKISKVLTSNNVIKINIYHGTLNNIDFIKFVKDNYDSQLGTPFVYSFGEKDYNKIKDYILNPSSEARKSNRKTLFPLDNYDNLDEIFYENENMTKDKLINNLDLTRGNSRYDKALQFLKKNRYVFLTGFSSGVDFVADKLLKDLSEDENSQIFQLKKYTAQKSLESINKEEYKNKYQALIYRNLFDPFIFVRDSNNDFKYTTDINEAVSKGIIKHKYFNNVQDKIRQFTEKYIDNSKDKSFCIITSQFDEPSAIRLIVNSILKNEEDFELTNEIKELFDQNIETIKSIFNGYITTISNNYFSFRDADEQNIISESKKINEENVINFLGINDVYITYGTINKNNYKDWKNFRKSLWYYLLNHIAQNRNPLNEAELKEIAANFRKNMETVYYLLHPKKA